MKKEKALNFAAIIVLLVLYSLPALSTDWRPKQSPRPQWRANGLVDTKGVKQYLDIAYYQGPDADPVKHKLDLYIPGNRTNFPVVVFIHGGGWNQGDKRVTTDPYGDLGRRLAKNGVAVAAIDYRLSPQFQFPTHIQDVARAFAWVHANIASYGGDPGRIFVCGHSAGGHLTALLATDERWLKEQGLSLKDIRGAIPVSGPFSFEGLDGEKVDKTDRVMIGRFLNHDPQKHKDASPVNHVESGKAIPPFLIMYGGKDFALLREQAGELAGKLEENGYSVKVKSYPGRNHFQMILDIRNEGDVEQKDILDFIAAH
jgi:acetyl esterase/lipase